MATTFSTPPSITTGNARDDGERGWFVGQFIGPSGGLRRRNDVELKWEVHPAGDRRRAWASNRTATTISILLSGHFRVQLRNRDGSHAVELARPGDYVIFAPGVEHHWEAVTEATILTLRTPSVVADHTEAPT